MIPWGIQVNNHKNFYTVFGIYYHWSDWNDKLYGLSIINKTFYIPCLPLNAIKWGLFEFVWIFTKVFKGQTRKWNEA